MYLSREKAVEKYRAKDRFPEHRLLNWRVLHVLALQSAARGRRLVAGQKREQGRDSQTAKVNRYLTLHRIDHAKDLLPKLEKLP